MKSFTLHKKLFLFIISTALSVGVFSQENTVKLIGFGNGKSETEALNSALRQCIEKTFGVFVSTNTEVSNDELIKDNIATLSSGNITSHEVIDVLQKDGIFTLSVSATVSPENIVKSYKSKDYCKLSA